MADLARADRIKQLREERGLRQQDVADAIGVELRSYQRQEATGGIKGENAKRLAEFYGVDLKWLLMGDTPDVFGALNGSRSELLTRLDQIDAALAAIAAKVGAELPDSALAEADAVVRDAEATGAQPPGSGSRARATRSSRASRSGPRSGS